MRQNVHRILDRKEDGVQRYRQERKMNQRLVESVLFTKAKSKKCGYKCIKVLNKVSLSHQTSL